MVSPVAVMGLGTLGRGEESRMVESTEGVEVGRRTKI